MTSPLRNWYIKLLMNSKGRCRVGFKPMHMQSASHHGSPARIRTSISSLHSYHGHSLRPACIPNHAFNCGPAESASLRKPCVVRSTAGGEGRSLHMSPSPCNHLCIPSHPPTIIAFQSETRQCAIHEPIKHSRTSTPAPRNHQYDARPCEMTGPSRLRRQLERSKFPVQVSYSISMVML